MCIEPTSGLDSQSSYNIIKFIRKLADAGMPLVCTIHQPSSVLFEYFDRLLLLGKGGKVTYFGDIGENSAILLDYFARNGARHCSNEENPAEYLLEAIGAGVGGKTDKDWVQIWKSSPEADAVKREVEDTKKKAEGLKDDDIPREFATSKYVVLLSLSLSHNHTYSNSGGTSYANCTLGSTLFSGEIPATSMHFNTIILVFITNNQLFSVGRILQSLLVGLVVGFSFWDLGVSVSDLNMRVLAIFQILVLGIYYCFFLLGNLF